MMSTSRRWTLLSVRSRRFHSLLSARCLIVSSLAALFAFAFLAAPSFAGSVVLGSSNWAASWDSSFDDPNTGNPLLVDIEVVAENATQVFIQKSATWITGPDPNTGLFPTVPIHFQQIGPTTVTQIVIEDEIITNLTGHDWTDFHMDILDSGDAAFNATLTDASTPNGFFTSPFDNQMWAGQIGPDLYTEFWVDGFGLGPGGSNAIIPGQFPGNVWFPGNGAFNGEMFIDVVPKASAPFTAFVLKETPTFVPEPTSAALVILGMLGLAGGTSRRRKS